MTEHTKEFLSRYPESYGSRRNIAPDYSRCCAQVSSKWGFFQCSRKNGHGPDGAYCKQHDPVEKKKRRQRREVEAKIKHWDNYERRYFVEAIGNAVLNERDLQPFVEAYRKREAEIEALALEVEK